MKPKPQHKPCPVCKYPRSSPLEFDGDFWRCCVFCGWTTTSERSQAKADKQWDDRRNWKTRRREANRKANKR